MQMSEHHISAADIATRAPGLTKSGNNGQRPVTTTSPVEGTSGSLSTAAGAIAWYQDAYALVNATVSGQWMASKSTLDANGSYAASTNFRKLGAPAYLWLRASTDNVAQTVTTTVIAGSTLLTLTIAGIDATNNTGTATVTGSWAGASGPQPVTWTGPINFGQSPFAPGSLPGWPANLLTAQFEQAAAFSPLVDELASMRHTQPAPGAGTGPVVMEDKGSSALGKALGWAAGGCIGGGKGGLVGCLLGAAGGFGASWVDSLIGWWTDQVEPEGFNFDYDSFPLPDPHEPDPLNSPQPHDDPPPPPSDSTQGNNSPDSGSATPGSDGPIAQDDGGSGSGGGDIDKGGSDGDPGVEQA